MKILHVIIQSNIFVDKIFLMLIYQIDANASTRNNSKLLAGVNHC